MTAAAHHNSSAHNAPSPKNQKPVDEAVALEHGINAEEYQRILDILGRTPNMTELGIFSVMWSEHCSYKSSRHFLARLPTKAPWVIQGPGENAGVIDIGDNMTAIFKMESHNHPSFIEPFQGAATGVGGILRDIFTMGARPIANINALRFGAMDHSKTRHLLDGVVSGIAHYGNCMGIPTVGGETQFHSSYNGNILVNAMTVGIADKDKIFTSEGAEPGQPVIYIGSKTGKDGIHGATMASAEFDDTAEENRPTVQVGDPFAEKLLLEACLELMQDDSIIAIQDMGAAGLTSSSVEIADKGQIGIHLNLDHVPMREADMVPYEIMLSESQERMLIILKPGREETAKQIMEKWDIDFAVIGTTTDDRNLRLEMYGHEWCNIPVPPLVDDAPKYVRPHEETSVQAAADQSQYSFETTGLTPMTALKKLISGPQLSSKRWIWEQYDTMVRGHTIKRPAQSDAAIVGLPDSPKALAISSDCNPRYCFADPVEGGKQAVTESWRNIVASGAKPLAITDNMNFGNPERPDIMGQFVGCIEGMREACEALSYPVISGNVSLYNETNGKAILPTPVIGGVGLLQDRTKALGLAFKNSGETLYVIGMKEQEGHLDQSLYASELCDLEQGPAPAVDLQFELKNGHFILAANEAGLISACHDIAHGGLLVALTKMAMASLADPYDPSLQARSNNDTSIGFTLDETVSLTSDVLFGEDQGRYIVSTNHSEALEKLAQQHDVTITKIGQTNAQTIKLASETINVCDLKHLNEAALPDYMNQA